MNVVRLLKPLYGTYAICLMCVFSSVTVSAADLYRYRNDQGTLVINHTVPPQFVEKGYDRLDSKGRLIERVEPPAPEAEANEEDEATAASLATVVAVAVVAQDRQDNYLLTSYSSAEEIFAVRDRKLAQLKREIEIMAGNVDAVAKGRLSVEQEAARFQRVGKDVPEAVTTRLSEAEERLKNAKKALSLRETEHAQTEILYAGYAQRFRKLKGLVKSAEAPETGSETALATDLPSVPSVGD